MDSNSSSSPSSTLSAGRDLLYDYQFRMGLVEPTEWAYNWDAPECSTPNPIPREGHATLWFVTNYLDAGPDRDLELFFRTGGDDLGVNLVFLEPTGSGGPLLFQIQDRTRKNTILLTGEVETKKQDPNVGFFAVFDSATDEGIRLMEKMMTLVVDPNMIALVTHSRTTADLGAGFELVVVSGKGDDTTEEGRCKDLATRFTLLKDHEEVARCHMSYRDGSFDPSMGPTIEMIAVKKSHRGQGLLKILWYWVRTFIEDNFTIECLNDKSPLKHVMIKATYLTGTEIDKRHTGSKLKTLTDKEFFYRFCGFSVRKQLGALSMVMNRRPSDEEAQKYIPLLTMDERRRRSSFGTFDNSTSPLPGDATFVKDEGARACEHCNRVQIENMRCARCKDIVYCSKVCQKANWQKHRNWCGKSRVQVLERLKEQGMAEVDEDGNVCFMR